MSKSLQNPPSPSPLSHSLSHSCPLAPFLKLHHANQMSAIWTNLPLTTSADLWYLIPCPPVFNLRGFTFSCSLSPFLPLSLSPLRATQKCWHIGISLSSEWAKPVSLAIVRGLTCSCSSDLEGQVDLDWDILASPFVRSISLQNPFPPSPHPRTIGNPHTPNQRSKHTSHWSGERRGRSQGANVSENKGLVASVRPSNPGWTRRLRPWTCSFSSPSPLPKRNTDRRMPLCPPLFLPLPNT